MNKMCKIGCVHCLAVKDVAVSGGWLVAFTMDDHADVVAVFVCSNPANIHLSLTATPLPGLKKEIILFLPACCVPFCQNQTEKSIK